MAINYFRLKNARSAIIALASGFAVTVLAIVSGDRIPQSISFAVGIGLVLATRSAAQSLLGPAVNHHEVQGGQLASRWAALGIGLVTGVAMLAVIFVAVLGGNLAAVAKSKVTFGARDSVYYSGAATKENAQALGDVLKNIGYFTDKGATVVLAKEQDATTVSFVVAEAAWNQPEMITSFEQIGVQIGSSTVGFPFKLRLVDSGMATKKEVTIGKAAIGSKDVIFYFGTATEAEANALGQALKTAGYLHDSGANVLLSKGDATIVSFVLQEGFWNSPEFIATYANVARKAAPSVGGPPITLRLVDASMETKKEIPIQ